MIFLFIHAYVNILPSIFQGFFLLLVSASSLAAPNYPKEAPSSPGISYEPVQHKKVKQASRGLKVLLHIWMFCESSHFEGAPSHALQLRLGRCWPRGWPWLWPGIFSLLTDLDWPSSSLILTISFPCSVWVFIGDIFLSCFSYHRWRHNKSVKFGLWPNHCFLSPPFLQFCVGWEHINVSE